MVKIIKLRIQLTESQNENYWINYLEENKQFNNIYLEGNLSEIKSFIHKASIKFLMNKNYYAKNNNYTPETIVQLQTLGILDVF